MEILKEEHLEKQHAYVDGSMGVVGDFVDGCELCDALQDSNLEGGALHIDVADEMPMRDIMM